MAVSRASLLRGQFRSDPDVIRPPWAIGAASDEARAFASACDACGRCAPACPEGIIVFDRVGRPIMDFAKGACTFCGDCATACLSGALVRTEDAAPWTLKAGIAAACLSFGGVDCRMCGDHCETRAIRFRPLGKGRWLPAVEAADCTGCGACVGVCPVKAIAVSPADSNPADSSKEIASCG